MMIHYSYSMREVSAYLLEINQAEVIIKETETKRGTEGQAYNQRVMKNLQKKMGMSDFICTFAISIDK